jgi:hypothetical protein
LPKATAAAQLEMLLPWNAKAQLKMVLRRFATSGALTVNVFN